MIVSYHYNDRLTVLSVLMIGHCIKAPVLRKLSGLSGCFLTAERSTAICQSIRSIDQSIIYQSIKQSRHINDS